MRMRPTLAAAAALSLAASLAQALPPGPRWAPGGAPGMYRPPAPVAAPFYPGWRAGYYPGPIYAGPRYWGPGITIAAPGFWGPWPYAWGGGYAVPYALPYAVPYAAPYSVAPVVVNAAPAAAAPDTGYWYYCTQPAGYFPYVQNCSQAWMKVLPQVPGDAGAAPRLAP